MKEEPMNYQVIIKDVGRTWIALPLIEIFFCKHDNYALLPVCVLIYKLDSYR